MPVAFDTHVDMLATKQDVEALRASVTAECTHLKWMIGVNITLNLLILGKLLLFNA